MVDNFRHGASGNLLASVNEMTGRVDRVVNGFGLNAREIERHPDSGRMLVGFQLPDWSSMLECCLEATRAFPGLVVQSWDVVPTLEGPLFIELNTFGDLDVLQLAHGYGIADDRWHRVVED